MFELSKLVKGRYQKVCEEPTRQDAFEVAQSFADDPRDDHQPIYVWDRGAQQFAGVVHPHPARKARH